MIETPRLRLRAWRDDDRDWYAAQCACPIVMAQLGGPKTRAECDARIDRMMAAQTAGEPAFWVVERRSDGVAIGDAGLKRVDAPGAPLQGEIEIGWRLARAAWGNGYAREAAEAALDIAFSDGADRVVALTSPRNAASRRLMARLGMRERPDLAFADPRFGPEDNPTLVHLIAAADRAARVGVERSTASHASGWVSTSARPPPAAALLHVRGLAKSVAGLRRLFSGLDLSVRAGELVAIVGESGVGKSTLLNIMAGLDDADEGEVRVGGEMLGPLDEAARTRLRRERIGFVFQAFHILPYLTLRQNVALPLALISPDAAAARTRADAMLARVGLGTRGGGYARDLSGGELQRVAIARALVHRPALILADEPTGNLDPETAARVLALFAEAVREDGAAAVIVTHSDATAAVADRVLTLTGSGLVPQDG